MPVSTNTTPYYDDFDSTKNFHRILFRPGHAVQARELTQIQTMLQKQIERFGQHIFTEGSRVIDGQTTISLGNENGSGPQYIKLENTVDGIASGSNVNVWAAYSNTTILGKEIELQTEPSGDNRSPKAKVVLADSWEGSNPPTLIVNYSTGSQTDVLGLSKGGHFQAGDLIKTTDGTFTGKVLTPVVANTEVGPSSIAGLANGVFFTKGYFAHALNQKIILDKYSGTPTYKIGLIAAESITTETSDNSLYDNAQGYNATIAPGAHRLTLTLNLDKQPDLNLANTDFFELMRVDNGVLARDHEHNPYHIDQLEQAWALSQYEQSGNYTTQPFQLSIAEPSLDFSANTERSTYLNLTLGPGTAYIKGRRVKTLGPIVLPFPKARDEAYERSSVRTDYGGYFLVSNVVSRPHSATMGLQQGLFSPTGNTIVDIHCVKRATTLGSTGSGVASGDRTTGYMKSVIGQARLLDMTHSGLSTADNNSIFKMYLDDFVANSIPLVVKKLLSTSNGVYLLDAGEAGLDAGSYTGGTITFETGDCAGNSATIVEHGNDGGGDYLLFDPPIQPFSQPGLNDHIRITMGLVHANSIIATMGGSGLTSSGSGAGRLSITGTGTLQDGRASADIDKNSKGADGQVWTASDNLDLQGNTRFLESGGTLVYPLVSGSLSTANINSVVYYGRRSAVVAAVSTGLGLVISKAALGMEADEEFYSSDWKDYTLQYLETGQQFDGNTVFTHGASLSSVTASSITFSLPPGTGGGARVNANEPILVTAPTKISAATPILKTLHIGKTSDAYGGVYGQSTWGANEAGTGNPTVVSQVGPMATNRSNGHVVFTEPNTIGGGKDNLGLPDVYNIRKVIDSLDQTVLPTNTMINDTSGVYDITSKYDLDTGQTGKLYGYSSLRLKAGTTPPTGQTIAIIDYFSADDNGGLDKGFFSVKSYTTSYSKVPTFESDILGVVNLRDCVDFRPRVSTLTNDIYTPTSYADHDIFESGVQLPFFPEIGGTLTANVGVYLPRTDKVALRDDLTFHIISGKSSAFAIRPADEPNSMTLATLSIPSFTFKPSDVSVSLNSNKRYTMKEIGKLETRIKNLEYYTSLNLLEKATTDLNIIDSDGNNRFKNGILADPFAGHGIGNVKNSGYKCAIDPNKKELRATYFANDFNLTYSSADNPVGSGIKKIGKRIMLDYTTTPYMTQPIASHAISTNPFQVVTYAGTMELDPSMDVWQDITDAPTIHQNLSGNEDNLEAFVDAFGEIGPYNTVFGQWQDVGEEQESQETTLSAISVIGTFGGIGRGAPFFLNETTTTTVTQGTQRTATNNFLTAKPKTTDLGTYVIEHNIIPWIRSRGVAFLAKGLRSNTFVYPFFDAVDVQKYTARGNILHLSSKSHLDSNVGVYETFSTAEATSYGTGAVFDILDDNTMLILDAQGTFKVGDEIVGTGTTEGPYGSPRTAHPAAAVTVTKYEHYSGTANVGGVYGGVTGTPTVNQIQLEEAAMRTDWGGFVGTQASPGLAGHAAESAALQVAQIVGQTIYIVSGPGAGQSRTVTGFNNATSVATVDSSWTVPPEANTSSYSIGPLSTNKYGRVAGVLNIPNEGETGLRFSAGEKTFKLTDSIANEPAISTTRASASYYAQGSHVTQANLRVDSLAWGLTQTDATQSGSRIESVTTSSRQQLALLNEPRQQHQQQHNRRDPLAQTFYIDGDVQNGYPSGIYLDSVDLWFKDVDSGTEDVTVQIRTTLNAVPTEEVLRSVTKLPSEINRSAELSGVYPSVANTSTMTNFKFDSPVYLSPAKDYAVVIVSNSVEYTAYIATQGLNEIGTSGTGAKNIDKQPHAGSLFKSQNGAIWTADQTSDMMFRLHRCVFPTNTPATLTLRNAGNTIVRATGSSNALGLPVHYNLAYLTIGESKVGEGADVQYSFATTPSTRPGLGLSGAGLLHNYITPVDTHSNIEYTEEKQITENVHGSARLRATFTTTSDHISPTVDIEAATLKVISNNISNTSLKSSSFIISNTSAYGYDNTDIVMVTGGGLADASVTSITPTINAVGTIITDVAGRPVGVSVKPGTHSVEHWTGASLASVSVYTHPGEGYFQTPTLTVVQNGANATSPRPISDLGTGAYEGGLCTFTAIGETSAEGGESSCKARYLTRTVSLASNFASSDLKVYINAHKPVNADVQVYMKVLHEVDPSVIDSEVNWRLMRQITPEAASRSTHSRDYREIEFNAPESPPHAARYTTTLPDGQVVDFNSYNKFAVKVCMWSNNSIDIPKVKDLRAIALDI